MNLLFDNSFPRRNDEWTEKKYTGRRVKTVDMKREK